MGLMKVAGDAFGGVMAEQWKEYFTCDALPCKQITNGCSQENPHLPVDFQLLAELINAKGDEGTGNRHGEGVGTQSGETAGGTQNRLEQQNNDAQNGNCSRSKENGTQAGAGHMRAAAGDGGDLQRGNDEHKGTGHGQQGDQVPMLL